MTLLEDFLSRDAQRIWSASCGVAKLRDVAQLDELSANLPAIRRATKGVELGGALFLNSQHLKFALEKLKFWTQKSGCLCQLYPRYLMFNPQKEQDAGNVQILQTESNQEQWATNYRCQCAVCGAQYSVQEGEYHYTWWQWRPLKNV